MTFAHPWLFLFLLPLLFAAWRLLRRARRSGVRYSAVSMLPAKTAGWRAKAAALTPFSLIAALALLTVAASRPRTATVVVEDVAEDAGDSIAIVMTADTSGSMAAMDLAPASLAREANRVTSRADFFGRLSPGDDAAYQKLLAKGSRLAVVKEKFAEFVRRRPDDQIALVTFGSFAEARSPLTFDHETLLKLLGKVELPRDNSESQTAIGDGLAFSLKLLECAKQKSKIIVLLSDGLNNIGVVSPEEASAIAAKRGIKVYTIGVGRGGDFDERQLKDIAKATKGRYFSVSDREALDKALAVIDRLEKSPGREVHTHIHTEWEEHFALWLYPGAALALASLLVSLAASRRFA